MIAFINDVEVEEVMLKKTSVEAYSLLESLWDSAKAEKIHD